MKYNENTAAIELSVRELCALTLGAGDLEYGGGRALFERGRVGAQIHRRWQEDKAKEYGMQYCPEVPLHHACRYGELTYSVSGRADAVRLDHDGLYTVEEIKSMGGRAFRSPVPESYMAQLRIYAYFLCCAKQLPRVRMSLVCVSISDERTRERTSEASVEELRDFYLGLLQKLAPRAKLIAEHTLTHLPAIAHMVFPYRDMRPGQEDMIRAVHRAVRGGERLFIQAPTGIGKTVSTLYPALRARGEGRCDRVFYLTAKASTRREAVEAVRRMVACGAPIRAVVLTAREHICPCAPTGTGGGASLSTHCNSVECAYAAGYYDRVWGALEELLTGGNGYNRTRLLEVAGHHSVCPYELSLDVSEFCDVIIGDYNYVFDPMVYLRRYFSPDAPAREKNVFLIDEAHNLPDRARDMYSATLECRTLERVYARVDRRDKTLNEALETLIRAMRRLRRMCRDTLTTDEAGREYGFCLTHAMPDEWNEKLRWFSDQASGWLRAHREEDVAPQVSDLLRVLREYFCILELYDEHYATCVEITRGELRVKLFCMDPSELLDQMMHRAVSTVLFSATLTPLSYFADVLGGGSAADRLSLPSPFDRENLGLFIVDKISTRYENREDSARVIASCIAATVAPKKGNYIVYFPSYAYMELVYRQFCARYPHVRTVLQKKGMRTAEKETFLDAFPADTGVLRVGFCVLGGSFSEGVDLPGSRLIGSVIVGVGLPGISNELNVLQEYYQDRLEHGYEYVYLYPGMNHVLQAAGRVIRREDDRGVVVLIDDRYATPVYRGLFPGHWLHAKYAGNANELAESVRKFWGKS